jgi:2-methylisocitrate lyase-like PEP mutase family enzyme
MHKSSKLKSLIESEEIFVVPDAYDGLTAKLIEKAGFPAVQCSGYSISLSQQIENEKKLTLENNLLVTKQIVDAVSIPVMADGENGYADGITLQNNIKHFIDLDVAGVNIEDQSFTNDSQTIIKSSQMKEKLETIKETIKNSSNPNFVLNARTDALLNNDTDEGIKIAIERANEFLSLGADLVFVCHVKTYDQLKLLSQEVYGPLSIAVGLPYNHMNFTINDCKELGIKRVSLPTYVIFNSIKEIYENLLLLKNDNSFTELNKKNKFSTDFLDILNEKK